MMRKLLEKGYIASLFLLFYYILLFKDFIAYDVNSPKGETTYFSHLSSSHSTFQKLNCRRWCHDTLKFLSVVFFVQGLSGRAMSSFFSSSFIYRVVVPDIVVSPGSLNEMVAVIKRNETGLNIIIPLEVLHAAVLPGTYSVPSR